tara:strand:- start:5416 stop:7041 length:1626 start_codon:yes stop_codon:yes gene_type:complete
MAITLRNNKGTALSYEEMDINMSSFFYSASVSSDAKQLSLHYTGSTLQSPGMVNIALNTYTGSSQVAGDIGQIQYNVDDVNFAGTPGMVYDATRAGLAIGTSSLETGEKLRVHGGNIIVDGGKVTIAAGASSASLAYGGTTKDLVVRNEYSHDNADVIFYNGNTETLRLKGDGSITHKGSDDSFGDFVISGSFVFGKTHEDNYRSKLFTWDSANTRIENNLAPNLLRGNNRGIMIEGPHTGHVTVGLQSTGTEAFNIISGPPTASYDATYNRLVANFGSDGNVGIGTSVNPTGYKFAVSGSIYGYSNLNISGSAIITGSLATFGNLSAQGTGFIGGTLSIDEIPTATSTTNYNFLVTQGFGQVVKQVAAAPIPVGGIIMWSGNISNIPSGWNLCDGTNTTPNLVNKFIVGASSDLSGVAKTNIEGSYTVTGGSTSHNHSGNAGSHTLTTAQTPSHDHGYKDSYYILHANTGVGAGGAVSGVDYVGPTGYRGSGDSDSDNKYVYYRNQTTNTAGSNGSHNHTISTDTTIPPYYALAYIMFTG